MKDNKARNSKIAVERIKEKERNPFVKRVLVVDDEPDVALTFKVGLEECHCDGTYIYTYNNPIEALLDFKPHFYDLLLVDV